MGTISIKLGKASRSFGRSWWQSRWFRSIAVSPRIGGKKRYHMYSTQLHALCPGLGRDKFFALLGAHDLPVPRRRRSVRTTNSYHRLHRYRNLLKGMEVSGPNQVWVADITYLRLRQGFAYLSLLTDRYSRKLVGWQVSDSLGLEGSLQTLRQAVSGRRTHRRAGAPLG